MTTNTNPIYYIHLTKQQLLYIQKCVQFSITQSEDLDNEIDEYEEQMGKCLNDMITTTTGQPYEEDVIHGFCY